MNKNYIVTKSNKLIHAGYDMSAYEQKLILTLASLVQPEDEDFKEYTFKIKEFMDLLDVENKNQYRAAAKATRGLLKKTIEMRERNDLKQFSWLCSATYKFGEGVVILRFAPELKEYMLFLKDFYTTYRLENILGLKSRYSIRIYELLKCNSYKKTFTIEIDELKKTLGANAKYLKVYADFKKAVLSLSQKEISEKTDISFNFSEIRGWRNKIDSICFSVISKKNHVFNPIDLEQTIVESFIPDNLIDRIKKTIGSDFHINALKKLIQLKGTEKIEYYIANWHKFDCISKKNIAGFFYECVIKEYIPPEQQQGNSKPIQSTNYTQRNYEDEDWESYYWQPEHDE